MGSQSWRGIAAGLACILWAFAAAPARAEPPPILQATLGDLTFHYSPAAWHIVREDGGLSAACLQADCRGVVFDFTVRDGSGACTRDAVRETTEKLFASARGPAVNIMPLGRFGLIQAESWAGESYTAPRHVYACLEWQGRDYRFAMRPETVGQTSWSGGALMHLLWHVTAPPADVGVLKLRDMELRYPTDRFRMQEMVPGQSVFVHCLVPTCRDEGEFLSVSAGPSETGCRFDILNTDWPEAEVEVTPLPQAAPDAPAFSLGLTHSPCRNYVPPRRLACAWHDGILYRISTTGGAGCSSSMGVPEEAFDDLVAGARLVPPR